MAEWTLAWEPAKAERSSEYAVDITPKGGNKEQRQLLADDSRRSLDMTFPYLSHNTIRAMRNFFDARHGSYESFTIPFYDDPIKGTGLGCNATAGTITDSGSQFSTFGFTAGETVAVLGSNIAGNDGYYVIAAGGVAAGTLTLVSEAFTDEANNSNLKVYRCMTARFVERYFKELFDEIKSGNVRQIRVIEDL